MAPRSDAGATPCPQGCVRCGACFGDAGCGEAPDAPAAAMLDEESLAAELAEVLMRRGFPSWAAAGAAEAAVAEACSLWRPCRADGSSDA